MEVKEINELLKRQEGYLSELQTIFKNTKKDSPSRKTVAYIVEKKALVTQVFGNATLNHNKLVREDLVKEHSYNKTNYFQNILDEYTEVMKYLDTCKVQEQVSSKNVEPETASGSTAGKDDSPKVTAQLARVRFIRETLRQAREALLEGDNSSYLKHLLTTLQGQCHDARVHHVDLLSDITSQQHEYIQHCLFEEVQLDANMVIRELCSRTSVAVSQPHPCHGNRRVNLPKIELPIFNGKYESWNAFSDLFRKMIHEDGTLTATEKIQYLKTHVKGDAAKLISHLTVCENHYHIAWSILESRFNNERLVVTKYINAILYAKKIDRPNAENLRILHDSVNESLEAIKTHGIDVSTWDPILTSVIASKWDTETNEKYEHQLTDPHKLQTLAHMMKFLERRFMCLETTGSNKQTASYTPVLPGTIAPKFNVQSRDQECWYCRRPNHTILVCQKFQALAPIDRIKVVRDNRKCRNCLIHDSKTACSSKKVCYTCGKQGHHSLLHVSDGRSVYGGPSMQRRETSPMPSTNKQATQTRSNVATTTEADVALLATALVQIRSADGTPHVFRALCDQGSEASFCTEQVAQLLAYPRNQIQAQVSGLADEKPKTSKFSVNVEIQPAFQSQYKLRVEMIIMSRLTGAVPLEDIPEIDTGDIKSKDLADASYYRRAPIDIILGVREFGEILTTKCRKLNSGTVAQETKFGWVLSGICKIVTKAIKVVSLTTRTTELQQLHKFWELEEVGDKIPNNSEDEACETYYQKTTVRNEDGSYTVRLPFKEQNKEYGDSRKRAAARLIQLEKRFAKDESLQQRYQAFLSEYLEMGHMRKVPRADNSQGKFYFPHQPVINENSLTTKLRVVFDGSSKASRTDVSLNENMLTGPRLQEDLTTILLRWRKHKIVFMADIEKMYRFIRIHKQDLGYQRILWRESPKNSIDEYELTTVTYGTASAPFLAVKTLQQLAIDEKDRFPEASKVALKDFYVDDVLSGHDNVQTAKKLQRELIQLLQAGGFNLRKWSSNCAELLENIPEENKEDKLLTIPLDETRKSLGVLWSPLEDKFSFHVTVNKNNRPTKRFILSEIAKLFDPLGWLAPIITNMKLIIQELWTNGTEWDQAVEGTVKIKWLEIQDQLKAIEEISIPRWCQYATTASVDLHGFCDASEKAYGAVIYCRVQVHENVHKVTMLQAKSKVAPKKQKATLPRLELCAAVLLAQLMKKVLSAMTFTNPNIYCWTDSMIALGWIKGEPERWKTFVANRVSEIQRTIPQAQWNHVISSQNPADIISRGIAPNKLQEFKLWWEGPEWLTSRNIPMTKTIPEICDEIKRSFHVTTTSEPRNELLERFSSFHRMVRVLSYCLRLKHKPMKEQISCEEIARTTKQVLKLVQQESFKEEYKSIKTKTPVNKKSKLSSLDPFLDADGLLRVGGRLQNANLPYDQKHPVILPYGHHITKIIIQDAHIRMLHGTNIQTLAYLRQKFWIIGAKVMVKKWCRRCIKCVRYKASTMTQKMGTLPAARVTESFPFSHTGVDYAGPIQIRAAKGRGHRSYRGYVAVFVCFASKSIHLEPAGDLSTESFIAAFRRFVARRGPVAHIYSDNATNFVGTANILYQEVLEISQSSQVQNVMTDMGITWHFIPPASPHFGGIWEAGVKSMKHHLRRVIGEQTLTFEEMTTFLSQIEACLNSRPLCALSEEANDNIVLTPSHLLIGREAVGTADPLSNIFTNLSTRWKQIQKMKKDFWKSWTKDYLHQLQQKYKWKNDQENLKIGAVVLMKEDNIGPSRWPIAKIIEVHEGKDNLTRVVTLQKSSGSIMKRSIHTLIPLPINGTEDDNQTSRNIQANSATVRTEQQSTRRNQRYAAKGKMSWWMLIMLLIQLIGNVTPNYTIKEVPPGFYVEQIGTARISRGVFRIETNYERMRLEEDYAKAKKAYIQFHNVCTQITTVAQDTHCKQLEHHLNEQVSKVEKTKEFLTEVNKTRKKRGLLGKFMTSVFGVNDEAYRDIESLNKNQEKLIEAANRQTRFMISAITQINSTEERVKNKLDRYQTKLNQMIDYLASQDHWYAKIDRNSVDIQVIQTYQLASNYIEEVIDYYAGLIEIYLSRASVYSILTPSNVSDIIDNANKKLPSNLKIIQRYLMDTKIEENATHIQVYAYFPIQDMAKYTFVHVTPIPRKSEDSTFQAIEIPNSYLGVDYNNEQYFDVNQDGFKNCLHRLSNYICFPGVVKNMQLKENCIVDQLFTNHTETRCPTRTIRLGINIVWQQLYMKNTWLFITKEKVIVSVICDGQREEVELAEVGIIRISENCLIKTSTQILAAQRLVNVEIKASYSKPVDFLVHTYSSVSNSFNITKELVIDGSQDMLAKLMTNEKTLQTSLDNTSWRQISNHTYVTSFVSSLGVFVVVVLTFCYGPRLAQCVLDARRRRIRRSRGEAEQSTQPTSQDNQGFEACSSPPTPATSRRKNSSSSAGRKAEAVELYQLKAVPEGPQNVHTGHA